MISAGCSTLILATQQFVSREIVCDYHGSLLSHKNGNAKNTISPENAIGYMFAFTFCGVKIWIDATDET